MSYKEFSLPLLFFFIQGILVPNFDDLHYIFLTEVVQMPKYEYDFLNTFSYVGILFFIFLYNQYFARTEAWLMVFISLILMLLMTVLMLANATRTNVDSWGIDDTILNGVIFFIST